jgi:hypothetical protein
MEGYTMANVMFGSATINGTDDEWWPFSDEHGDSFQQITRVLQPNQSPVQIHVDPLKWGGECRVELDLFASVNQQNQIHVTGEARLFEGVTENTDDLEDTQSFAFDVGPGIPGLNQPATYNLSLFNNELFGGDSASIDLSFFNIVA